MCLNIINNCWSFTPPPTKGCQFQCFKCQKNVCSSVFQCYCVHLHLNGNNNSNGWNVTFIFLYSIEHQFIFLYSTELLCLNLKAKYLVSVYLSNTVLLFGSAHKVRLDKKNKKNKKSCSVPRHLPDIHKENQHPMGKEESR